MSKRQSSSSSSSSRNLTKKLKPDNTKSIPEDNGQDDADEIDRLDSVLVDVLHQRGPDKTCWPSEIPRKLFHWKTLSSERKKELMSKTRKIAYQRAHDGFLQVLQKGSVVPNPTEETVRGPIRLQLLLKRKIKDES